MFELSSSETTVRVRQLEWPQEVVNLLEVRTNSVDFVDQVFNRQDTVLTQRSFNDRVVRQSNSLLVDLTETSLVNQLSDGRQRWVTVGNVRFSQLDQFFSSLGQSDKNTGVDLSQSQQLHNLSWLWWDLHDTLDSDNEDQLRLSINVVGASSLGFSLGFNDRSFGISVLLGVSSSSVVDSLSLFSAGLKMG